MVVDGVHKDLQGIVPEDGIDVIPCDEEEVFGASELVLLRGNIWVKDGRIIWLDLGMMGRLSARDRNSFRRAIMALVTNDVYGDQVLELFYDNKLEKIKEYCESDTLNTYWLFLKYEQLLPGGW